MNFKRALLTSLSCKHLLIESLELVLWRSFLAFTLSLSLSQLLCFSSYQVTSLPGTEFSPHGLVQDGSFSFEKPTFLTSLWCLINVHYFLFWICPYVPSLLGSLALASHGQVFIQYPTHWRPQFPENSVKPTQPTEHPWPNHFFKDWGSRSTEFFFSG